MASLNHNQAQKIANGIMSFIPYNINIMDEKGYIIASGDKDRLNTLHMGAVHALSTMEAYIVQHDTKTERKGVNLPIMHNNEAVGVIGISGEVADVMPIAEIVQFTAKLMLENQEYNSMALLREAQQRDYLLEWANYDKDAYSSSFIERGRTVDIDIMQPYVAVLLDVSKDAGGLGEERLRRQIETGKDEHMVWYRRNDILMAMVNGGDLCSRVEQTVLSLPGMERAYIGMTDTTLHNSISSARQTRTVSAALYGREKRVISYADTSLDQALLSSRAGYDIFQLQELLLEHDPTAELAETVYVYFNNTNSISKICDELHIHRNTLNYRINRIAEITGLNPRNCRDLSNLYIAVLRNRVEGI